MKFVSLNVTIKELELLERMLDERIQFVDKSKETVLLHSQVRGALKRHSTINEIIEIVEGI